MQAVAGAILDVAFATEMPSIALNIVHPKPVAWSSILQHVSEALHAANVTEKVLPLVPFADWFAKLEQRASRANEKEMRRVVSRSYPPQKRRLLTDPFIAYPSPLSSCWSSSVGYPPHKPPQTLHGMRMKMLVGLLRSPPSSRKQLVAPCEIWYRWMGGMQDDGLNTGARWDSLYDVTRCLASQARPHRGS